MDEFGRKYLTLVLEMDKHIDGYVDSYFGPPEMRAAVAAAEKRSPATLRTDLAWLRDNIPTGDPQRVLFLSAELVAIGGTLQMLDGESLDYLTEVNLLYDISPAKVDETIFMDAHRELDELMPGPGSIAERMQARRKRLEIPPDQLLPLLELARAETRHRTAALFDLPPGEGFSIELVSDKPWGGYNWYLGNGQSRIDINTDSPMTASYLLNMLAHEAYPGHHTELMLKEKLLLQERGYTELSANLLHSPMAVISEGIATTAQEIIFPDNQAYEWIEAVVLPQIGVTDESAESLQRFAKATRILRYVSGNAAILHNTGACSAAETVEYIQTYGLLSAERAQKSFSFITHPLYRSYTFTYTSGYDLIEQAAAGDKPKLFKRLLTEQIIPSQLTTDGLQTPL
ncbi:MAG: hypothetical protein M9965_04000 [Anaerolineae bacterium]|nr:hypothetical protein [Anaerolineae bacterium]